MAVRPTDGDAAGGGGLVLHDAGPAEDAATSRAADAPTADADAKEAWAAPASSHGEDRLSSCEELLEDLPATPRSAAESPAAASTASPTIADAPAAGGVPLSASDPHGGTEPWGEATPASDRRSGGGSAPGTPSSSIVLDDARDSPEAVDNASKEASCIASRVSSAASSECELMAAVNDAISARTDLDDVESTLPAPTRAAKLHEDLEADAIPPYVEILHDFSHSGEGTKQGAAEAVSSDKEIASLGHGPGEEELTRFDGYWEYKGKHMATIKGNVFSWVESHTLKLIPTKDGFVIDNLGDRCEATLNENGGLDWDDGQAWTRMRDLACSVPAAPALPPSTSAKVRGNAAFSEGNYEEAARLFAEAITQDPFDKMLQQFLELARLSTWEAEGIPVMRLNNYQAAVDLVAEYRKGSAEAKAKGSAAFREKRFGEAIQHLSKAVRLDPSDGLAQSLLEYSKMHEWERQDIPVFRLGDYATAMQLVEQHERVDEMTMDELKEWYTTVGFPDERSLERTEIAKFYKLIKIWQALPLSELYRECDQRNLSIRRVSLGDAEAQRKELAKQLLLEERMDAWEAKGLEAKRIGAFYTMIQVVQECEEVDGMSFDELLHWYKGLGFPQETRLQQAELSDLSKRITVWQALPLQELQKECRQKGITVASDLPHAATAEQRVEEETRLVTNLTNELVVQDRMDAWEATGEYEAKRLGDVDTVTQVIIKHFGIDQMSDEELVDWYTGCSFPNEKNLQRKDIAALYKKVAVWQFLPMTELRKECKRKGLTLSAVASERDQEEERLGLLNSLLVDDRMDHWESQGYQARRIGNPDDVVQLVDELEALRQLSTKELKQRYLELGLPEEEDLDRREITKLYKKVRIWNWLPLVELQNECRAHKISVAVLPVESEQYRSSLMSKLLIEDRKAFWDAKGFEASRISSIDETMQAVEAYQAYAKMSDEDLRKSHSEVGLPESRGLSRADMLRNIKMLIVWEMLPLRELQKECKTKGLPSHQGLPIRSINERRAALVQRLRMDLQVNQVFSREPFVNPSQRLDVGLPSDLLPPTPSALSQGSSSRGPSQHTLVTQRTLISDGTSPCSKSSGSCMSLSAVEKAEMQRESEAPGAGGNDAAMDWYEQDENDCGAGEGVISLLDSEAELQDTELFIEEAPECTSSIEGPKVPGEASAETPPEPALADGGGGLAPSAAGAQIAEAETDDQLPDPPGHQDSVGLEDGLQDSVGLEDGLQDWRLEAKAERRASGGNETMRLLAWAKACNRKEHPLLVRLVDLLVDEELEVDDLMPVDAEDSQAMLQELGLNAAEITQVRTVLQDFYVSGAEE